jgi:diguanylate cyclase (GGDEF)-like protein/PAS domain S-box-containing protein
VPVRPDGGAAIAEWVGIMCDIDVAKNAGLALQEREGRLTSVLATAAEAIVLVDDRGTIHQANAAAEHIFGWAAEELVGQSAARLMPAMLGHHHNARVAAHAENGNGAILGMRRELKGQRRDGSVFPIEITVTQWADGAGRSWYTGVMRDVSAQREAAAALAESEARFRLLAEHSGDVVALNDIDGTRRYVSPAVERVLGWQPEDIVGRKGSEFIHPDDRPLLAAALAAMRAGEADTTVTYRHRRADGSWLWVDGRARLLPAAEGAPPDRYVGLLRDASLRKAAEAKLQETLERLAQMAATDGLTGINNRRGFDSALDREWRQSEREQLPLSVALVDADSFKLFNDHYGHLAGDDCLRSIAAQVQAAGRRPSDVAARYGGEEFVLLMPNTDEAGALLVAERLRRLVEAVGIQHAGNKAGSGIVTVSAGVATVRPFGGGTTPKALLETADAALYRAKESGRNCVEGGKMHSMPETAEASCNSIVALQ